MSDEATQSSPPARQRPWLKTLVVAVAAGLLSASWIIGNYPPVPRSADLEDVSVAHNIAVAGALPWLLQWAGLSLGLLAIVGRNRTRRAPAMFATLVSLAFATIWWIGLIGRFWGMNPLDAAVAASTFEVQSFLGGATVFDELLFHFIGPIVGPTTLAGPISMRGWSLFPELASTALVIGYLYLVGRWCRMGCGERSRRNAVRFAAGMIVFFLPPFLRLALELAATLWNHGVEASLLSLA
jgi:hypothetical protein